MSTELPRARPKFFYLLSTQYENLGDLVINRECLALLRERGDVLVKSAGVPDSFVDRLGLAPSERCNNGRIFYQKLIASARAGAQTWLVLVPGAAIGGLTLSQTVRHVALIGAYATLKMLGVKIVRLGASFGPFSGHREWIERWKSHTMAFIGLRDRLSLKYAAQIGLAQASPFPDFAFMLPTRTRVTGSADGSILLSFRADNSRELDEIGAVVARFLARIDPAGSRSLTMVSQVERDRPTGRMLAERVAGGRTVTYVDAAEGEPKLFESYARAACVLSNRLHVLIFAAGQGAPIRALINPDRNHKIIGLFEDAGLSERLVDITHDEAIDAIPQPDTSIDPEVFARNRAAVKASFEAMLAK